ncbi:MAG: glucose-6-phosphate dehydrogenase [Planctomycetales bacterium]
MSSGSQHFVSHPLASQAASSSLGSAYNVEASIVIFGASGDLTARKLLPALFQLWREGYLSPRSPIIGVARRPKTDESFRQELLEGVSSFARSPLQPGEWEKFAAQLHYLQHDISNPADYPKLSEQLTALEKQHGVVGKRLVYLATTPDLFVPAVTGMGQAGMTTPAEGGWTRVVFEKPFGHDLESSRQLSQILSQHLAEDQIYRIDHYLGKETVQNILLFRFGNSIFEPLFNRTHVDHVQITVAESQGMERGRGGYYDEAGALRDVLQNHVLQLLCLVAMEPPAMFRAKEIRDEKLKVLQALAPGNRYDMKQWAVAGQYTAAEINGKPALGYRQEERIPPDSRRETYAALDVRVDNWRWAGVPFFLRTGKRMPHRVSEIAIQFKLPPLHLFTTVECEGDICDLVGAKPNTLVFRIQPSESISFMVSTKRPGMQYQIEPVQMDFSYEKRFEKGLPEAYERLLLDVLRGDSTLFTRSDELEAAWTFCTPILEAWERPDHQPEPYAAGTWGPTAADQLLTRIGARWRKPKPE